MDQATVSELVKSTVQEIVPTLIQAETNTATKATKLALENQNANSWESIKENLEEKKRIENVKFNREGNDQT